MSKIGSKIVKFISIIRLSLDLIKKSKKITEIADQVTTFCRGIELISNYCFKKTVTISI